jgi:predicted nucleic acid-binding protein
VIAIDTQILIYAHRAEYPGHLKARACIAELALSGERWAIPMHCLVEFYAAVTGSRMRPPSTPEQATEQIDSWLSSPTCGILSEDAKTWMVTRDLLRSARIMGGQAYDARIAAVCLQHGVTTLWTNDRGFFMFPALHVLNPLTDIPSRADETRAAYGSRSRGMLATPAPPRAKPTDARYKVKRR